MFFKFFDYFQNSTQIYRFPPGVWFNKSVSPEKKFSEKLDEQSFPDSEDFIIQLTDAPDPLHDIPASLISADQLGERRKDIGACLCRSRPAERLLPPSTRYHGF